MITDIGYTRNSNLLTRQSIRVVKVEITLNASITDGLYFQLHDSNVIPANGAVPLRCWPAAECGFKDFKIEELSFSLGCYYCLSTTKATKTLAVGVNDLMDIAQVELADGPLTAGLNSVSVVGDLTTSVNTLQVWSEADGVTARKKLVLIEVIGTVINTGTNYLLLFSTDAVSANDVPIAGGSIPLVALTNYTGANGFFFGELGRVVETFTGVVWKYGCTIMLSSTAGFYTAPLTDVVCLKAVYR